MSARQMLFLASQGNKTIQKPSKIGAIEQFCTILSSIFKQVVGRQTQFGWKPVKKVRWRNRLGKAKKLFHNLTE